MWPNPVEKAVQTRFAQFVGISQQAVSQLKDKGVLAEGGTYREWLLAYVERLRTEAAGRDQGDRLSSARIRETEMSANLKEIEYMDRMKLVVWREDIAPLLENLCLSIQSQVMNAKDKIIEAIESKHALTLDDDSVDKHLRAALDAVAGSAGELAQHLLPSAEETTTG
ncbi:hypothetical protein FKG94_03160 [Exilibacterium tricleocarpae]|uniref:Terminase small subunit n=1 Tax=Exilibacterium tricleocarpae TaxID=2591008 RepID=A0A545U736_9GAMM|nr:hypothetical protein [Exilibacterium tricleocarpae]TQV85203.1 hypothetical protein FKG94_03160 [Exilibacterium tricleocarpae]